MFHICPFLPPKEGRKKRAIPNKQFAIREMGGESGNAPFSSYNLNKKISAANLFCFFSPLYVCLMCYILIEILAF